MYPNSCSSYYNQTNCLQRSMDSALDPRKVPKAASLAGTRTATDTSRRWFAAAAEEPVRHIPSSSSRPGSALESDMSTARWVYTHFVVRSFVNSRRASARPSSRLCLWRLLLFEVSNGWWYGCGRAGCRIPVVKRRNSKWLAVAAENYVQVICLCDFFSSVLNYLSKNYKSY